jgi:type I restriction enzyme M protein
VSNQSAIVQRLWNYCNILRDDGVSYGDYVEQLTYLLFLKMADEQESDWIGSLAADPRIQWQSGPLSSGRATCLCETDGYLL